MTIKVHLDVAGMYYSRKEIEVPESASIRDVMVKASVLDSDPINTTTPILNFSGQRTDSGTEYLHEIRITHRTPAVSRQNKERKYSPGVYIGYDTSASFAPNKRFVSYHPEDRSVLAWQYYVYDKAFIDKNRRLGSATRVDGSLVRKVIPYSLSPDADGQKLEGGDTIVWRLVTIFIRPVFDNESGVAASVS